MTAIARPHSVGCLGLVMSFTLFLRGLLATLVVFAIATYALTQSVWTTVINTAICAVLIQAGYFLAVLFLVARNKGAAEQAGTAAKPDVAKPENQGEHADKSGRLRGVPRSGH
jgi:exopolysaccharide production repressor protein